VRFRLVASVSRVAGWLPTLGGGPRGESGFARDSRRRWRPRFEGRYGLLVELPGADLVEQGICDLAAGIESVEALLVSIGATRLRATGLDVPQPLPDADMRLYELLAREDEDSAHGRYNALIRRLVSYERAAECAR
jgi:hypothetical protein